MSWILGVVGENINDTVKNKIQSLHHNALFTAGIHGKFFVVAGGNSQTLHSIQNNQTTVLVAGLGLRRTDQSTDILTTGQWEILLQQEKPNIAALNGHFIAIRYRNNILECFSDRVGLRTLYFGHAEFGWIFSTKLSWVSQHSSRTSIDWKIFGSKWLCVQQFTHESPVLTIRKLPPNGSARIEKNELTIDSTPWIFVKPNVATKKNAVDILKSLLDVNERNLNLGMSGGLDSRVLFSLLSSGKKNFTTYAFGRQDNPDVAYARMISEHGDIPFRELSGKFPSAEECWTLMHDYVLQSNLAEGAATSVRLRHYPELRNAHSLMIDGGNGEIARRQFLQRLLISARNDIFHLRANRLYG
ncbi:MAG: hypothetical protein HYV29_06445, partial [Ignavibacteriales bacterium]|nr:hypothetical protein [Ignavibacteriales bacterium]